ncbi:MAG: endonuclease/exonuclease/phosphatase family protein [Anaerolinea sp.]
MKLVTWNCQGAFRKKYPALAALRPDVAVVQECESLERIPWKQGNAPMSATWYGEKPTRGVGIFSWTGVSFQVSEMFDPTIHYAIPVEVKTPIPFHLIAVWTMKHADWRLAYSGQAYRALGVYREFILSADTVILGDFNSNQRSTPRGRIGNHAVLAANLQTLGLVSAYHFATGEKTGMEKTPTFFRGRKAEQAGHIDYVFFPARWIRRLKRVEVGASAEWLEYSDHCPVVVEFVPRSPYSMV